MSLFRPAVSSAARGPVPRTIPGEVPDYIARALRRWCQQLVDHHPEFHQPASLRVQSGQGTGPKENWYDFTHELLRELDKLARASLGDDWAITDNHWVSFMGGGATFDGWRAFVEQLERILEDAGAPYRVQRMPLGLQRRTDPGDAEAVNGAIAAAVGGGAKAAADDLAAAWEAVHGRHPKPSEAYRLAVRAVEHVTVPVTVPADKVATLGKVLNHVRGTVARWSVDVGNGLSGDVLVAMLEALWRGQEDRHGGQPDYAEVTVAQAEGAVQLATTLVRWFADDRVRKV